MDKEKQLTKLRRFIEERLVVDSATVPKILAFGSGAYIIYTLLPKTEWVIIKDSVEKTLPAYWAGYAPFGWRGELRERKVGALTLWDVAVSLFGSYMFVEHGSDMLGLAGKLVTSLK